MGIPLRYVDFKDTEFIFLAKVNTTTKERRVRAFRGVTHIVIAGTLYMAISDFWTIDVGTGIALLFLSLGSVLPDIDHPASILGRYIRPISKIVKHRNGYTHSFLGAFLFPLPILFISSNYYILTMWGYLFHLIADTVTPYGVRWLFPLTKRKYTLNAMKAGGVEEAIIVIMCITFLLQKNWI